MSDYPIDKPFYQGGDFSLRSKLHRLEYYVPRMPKLELTFSSTSVDTSTPNIEHIRFVLEGGQQPRPDGYYWYRRERK